jgi:hypothetical protein
MILNQLQQAQSYISNQADNQKTDDASHAFTTMVPPSQSKAFTKGNWDKFLQTFQDLATATAPTPIKSAFKFKFTIEAAIHNSKILKQDGYDLEKAIAADKAFTLSRWTPNSDPYTNLIDSLHTTQTMPPSTRTHSTESTTHEK